MLVTSREGGVVVAFVVKGRVSDTGTLVVNEKGGREGLWE